jgi:hypothetical protein
MGRTAVAPEPKETVKPSVSKVSDNIIEKRINIIKSKFYNSPLKCKAHHLWGNTHYRVNLHNMDNCGIIEDSYFAHFNENDELVLSQEIKVKKSEN